MLPVTLCCRSTSTCLEQRLELAGALADCVGQVAARTLPVSDAQRTLIRQSISPDPDVFTTSVPAQPVDSR